jgi:electron transport complex protein RnfG
MTALPRQMARSAALLGLVAMLGTALLAGVNTLTRDRIVEQQRRAVLVQLNQVLPASAYDNDLHEDLIVISDPDQFRHRAPVRVYRARLRGAPAAAIFDLATPDGYNGDIRLLVAIRYDGRISGVRVVEHRETPGLGDPIERRRSDWITRFDGRSLDDPQAKGWAVRRDGGEFDQFTGATITPRAVVAAVQRALTYFAANREQIFTLEAMSENNEPRG